MKDTDYLTISARVRVLENSLLTRERRERMVDARSDEEAVKILTECGYAEPEDLSANAVNGVLNQARAALFDDLAKSVPQPSLVDVFRIKYDYHNAKALLKAEALGENAKRLLMPGGRYEPDLLAEDFHRGDMEGFSETFRTAVDAAQDALAEEKDPQKSDLILDRACYAEMAAAATDCGSEFLQGYVRLSVDTVNLRTLVRCARMGVPAVQAAKDLLPGGNVDVQTVADANQEAWAKLFPAELHKAAEIGATAAVPGGESLTAFERACDNALVAYLSQAKRIPFGEQPVVGYLCAREAEATAIRTILSLHKAGAGAETIRERLRESYV